MKISKSDYVSGLTCPLALWFKKYRKDLTPEMNQAVLEQGNEIGKLAQKCFLGGIAVEDMPWTNEALEATSKLAREDVKAIYEAVAMTDSEEYCAADILRKNQDDTWDIIEVKSSTQVKDYHLIDTSFQYYVFTTAGYKIKRCFIMTVNNEYVRRGELEPEKLFKLDDVTEQAKEMAKDVPDNLMIVRGILSNKDEQPVCDIGAKCSKNFDCAYINHCWQDIPSYSIFDVLNTNKAEIIFKKYKTADLKKLPATLFPESKMQDIECYLQAKTVKNGQEIKSFLAELHYPLYFLDYETINSAIPLFGNTRPYQQVPFQFSLHIREKEGGELKHLEFLHKGIADPREDFIKALIGSCGKSGSVVVYNAQFERMINNSLAKDFPQYGAELEAINNRMVDLLIPFRKRFLYSHQQEGSASIKKVLPAFTELSYDGMEIANGGDASEQYLAYIKGLLKQEDADTLLENLSKYCSQDTLAMVKLLDVLTANSKMI